MLCAHRILLLMIALLLNYMNPPLFIVRSHSRFPRASGSAQGQGVTRIFGYLCMQGLAITKVNSLELRHPSAE